MTGRAKAAEPPARLRRILRWESHRRQLSGPPIACLELADGWAYLDNVFGNWLCSIGATGRLTFLDSQPPVVRQHVMLIRYTVSNVIFVGLEGDAVGVGTMMMFADADKALDRILPCGTTRWARIRGDRP